MTKKFICLLAATVDICAPTFVLAQRPKAGEGSLMVQDKNYPLTHAVAYETTIDDDDLIVVLLSGQAIPGEKLKEVRAAEREGNSSEFKRPYLRLEFTKAGEFKLWNASAGNTSLGRRSGNATGELKLQDGRVIGKASQPNDTESMFHSGFDVHFDVALIKTGESLPMTGSKKPGPAADVKPNVTGLFKGNGKEAKLAFVSAHWREPFSDQPSIVLVFSEKDHSKDKKPDFNAAFGRFGSALIISLHEGGDIFGCQVVHTAHSKQGFTSLGSIKTNDFKFEDGKVEGQLTSDGEQDTFGEKWEVDLKFVAPLGEIPPEFQTADQKKPVSLTPETSSTKKSGTKLSEKREAPPAADQFKVSDLAITKDASDVEYKTLVEHVTFKSKGNVKSVATELSANLKAQGWTNDGGDLITPASSILKRKRGEATLTIFVKPEGGGSEVKIFTAGLSWEGK